AGAGEQLSAAQCERAAAGGGFGGLGVVGDERNESRARHAGAREGKILAGHEGEAGGGGDGHGVAARREVTSGGVGNRADRGGADAGADDASAQSRIAHADTGGVAQRKDVAGGGERRVGRNIAPD